MGRGQEEWLRAPGEKVVVAVVEKHPLVSMENLQWSWSLKCRAEVFGGMGVSRAGWREAWCARRSKVCNGAEEMWHEEGGEGQEYDGPGLQG